MLAFESLYIMTVGSVKKANSGTGTRPMIITCNATCPLHSLVGKLFCG